MKPMKPRSQSTFSVPTTTSVPHTSRPAADASGRGTIRPNQATSLRARSRTPRQTTSRTRNVPSDSPMMIPAFHVEDWSRPISSWSSRWARAPQTTTATLITSSATGAICQARVRRRSPNRRFRRRATERARVLISDPTP